MAGGGDTLNDVPTMRVNASSRGISKPLLILIEFFMIKISSVRFDESSMVEASCSGRGLGDGCGVAASYLAGTRLANVVLGHPAVRVGLGLLRAKQLDILHLFALAITHIGVLARLFSVGMCESSLGRGSCRTGR